MEIRVTRARARRWAEHDAKIPYRDDCLARRNGTNRAGRRPHSFMDPQLQRRPDNDNREAESTETS